jgi:small multidrug resistance family-3 protein
MRISKAVELSVMVGAAFLEVGGDALIRKGLRGGGLAVVVLGFGILGSYGVLLTWLEVDFARLLGAYVGLFALISLLFGRLVFREQVSPQTWFGLAIVLVGSLIIQFASSEPS